MDEKLVWGRMRPCGECTERSNIRRRWTAWEWVTFGAACLLNLRLWPQVYTLQQTHDTASISGLYYAMGYLGLLIYFAYAWKRADPVYLLSNLMGLLGMAVVIAQVLAYGWHWL